jgi:hypothetical protein
MQLALDWALCTDHQRDRDDGTLTKSRELSRLRLHHVYALSSLVRLLIPAIIMRFEILRCSVQSTVYMLEPSHTDTPMAGLPETFWLRNRGTALASSCRTPEIL